MAEPQISLSQLFTEAVGVSVDYNAALAKLADSLGHCPPAFFLSLDQNLGMFFDFAKLVVFQSIRSSEKPGPYYDPSTYQLNENVADKCYRTFDLVYRQRVLAAVADTDRAMQLSKCYSDTDSLETHLDSYASSFGIGNLATDFAAIRDAADKFLRILKSYLRTGTEHHRVQSVGLTVLDDITANGSSGVRATTHRIEQYLQRILPAS